MKAKIVASSLIGALTLAVTCGCAGTAPDVSGGGGTSMASSALEALGLRKPAEIPELQRPPRTVAVRLHASDKLNVDRQGKSMAVIARIYKLRQSAAFEQAPYDTFLSPEKEKDALGADLLEVKEVILVPGQHYEVSEKVAREAAFIGVVALFHSPSPQRWRYAFNTVDAEKLGMTIGANACALSVPPGAAPALQSLKVLSPVRCQ
jgi:type VI secretion system protein VasD